MLEALKTTYKKHWLSDDSVGWNELGDKIMEALVDVMGQEDFDKFLQEIYDD